jgi:hypothetical protein
MSKILVLTSIVGLGLGIGITIGLAFPHSDTDNSLSSYISNSTALTAQEERSIVPLDQIVSGGPPPDGIPSIDNPNFILVQEADEILEDHELVVGQNINEDIRAYPLQILVWHEIVNDIVGNNLLSIMFY